MSIIAERGLFVRLLVQSGKFESAAAEALVDAIDSTTREPATKGDLQEVRAELKSDIQELRAELKADIQAVRAEMTSLRNELKLDILDLRKDLNALSDKLVIRLGGLMFVMLGLFFAALRLT
jgi:tRNA U34 5-carboxymethylaminomethyl modifying GTPase MnmE/TrmE